jgi:hypothetical protein
MAIIEPKLFFTRSWSAIIGFFFINWTLRMSDNLPERVQILGHVHILCITVWEKRSICCQIFFDLLLKSAFERIFFFTRSWMAIIEPKLFFTRSWSAIVGTKQPKVNQSPQFIFFHQLNIAHER